MTRETQQRGSIEGGVQHEVCEMVHNRGSVMIGGERV